MQFDIAAAMLSLNYQCFYCLFITEPIAYFQINHLNTDCKSKIWPIMNNNDVTKLKIYFTKSYTYQNSIHFF